MSVATCAALREAKSEQLDRFRELRARFADDYAAARHAGDPAPFLREDWGDRQRDLERAFLPEPPLDFLHHPAILYTMFVSDRFLEPELATLHDRWDEEALGSLLAEDPVGAPILCSAPGPAVATSPNAVHHLHHLARFAAGTGVDPGDLERVVEWGGGYGSLARLFRRVHRGAPTYVIIDTPIFSCLQRLYLDAVFGPGASSLIVDPTVGVEEGKFNLLPVGLVGRIELHGDLFVSTWALNESTTCAQRHVVQREWFDAPRLLLGMHDGEWLIEAAVAGGARREPLGEFMPHQNYVLR